MDARGDVWTASRVTEVIDQTDCACVITAITWDDCCEKRAGGGSSPLSEPASATKKLSSSGMCNAGPLARKSRKGAVHHGLGRRSGLLLVADGGAHVGTLWARSDPACSTDP